MLRHTKVQPIVADANASMGYPSILADEVPTVEELRLQVQLEREAFIGQRIASDSNIGSDTNSWLSKELLQDAAA